MDRYYSPRELSLELRKSADVIVVTMRKEDCTYLFPSQDSEDMSGIAAGVYEENLFREKKNVTVGCHRTDRHHSNIERHRLGSLEDLGTKWLSTASVTKIQILHERR